MASPYHLLLRYDARRRIKVRPSAVLREGVDDPSKLGTAPAHVSVDFDDYRLARETGEWRFRPDRGVYKE